MKRRRRPGGFRPVEEVAAAAGALLPHSHRGRHLRALAAWRTAVGDHLTRTTRVARLEGGLMTVQVSGDAYGESVQRLERQILKRVQQQMGSDAPRRIRVEVTPGFWRPPQAPAQRLAGAAPQWSVSDGGAALQAGPAPDDPGRPAESLQPGLLEPEDVATVRDPQQRKALLQVANRYLARRSGKR